MRKFKTPLHVFEDLPNLVSTTQVCFSPEDRLVVTGTSADRNGQGAGLVFIDLSTQSIVRKVAMPASVAAIHWHPRLNQIFVGTGRLSQRKLQPPGIPSVIENILTVLY